MHVESLSSHFLVQSCLVWLIGRSTAGRERGSQWSGYSSQNLDMYLTGWSLCFTSQWWASRSTWRNRKCILLSADISTLHILSCLKLHTALQCSIKTMLCKSPSYLSDLSFPFILVTGTLRYSLRSITGGPLCSVRNQIVRRKTLLQEYKASCAWWCML